MKRRVSGKQGGRPSGGGGSRQQPKGAGRRRGRRPAQGPVEKGTRRGKQKSGRTRPPGPEKAGSTSRRSKPGTGAAEGPERLQKVLAAAGLGSRRQCEELIVTGRVEVDRKVVMQLGTRVDPQCQQVRVDGVELRRPETVWYALNKPVGVVCTNRDPGGRPRAVDLVPESKARLFPVGRLDMNSEGLLLLTNDGELANQLTHPRYGIKKTYRVLVAGQPTGEILAQLRRGVYLSEGLTKITGITIKRHYKKSTVLEMVLEEGKNREIRRVLARVGHKVMRLVRIATGPIKLGDLEPGASRRLTQKEIESLRRHVREARS